MTKFEEMQTEEAVRELVSVFESYQKEIRDSNDIKGYATKVKKDFNKILDKVIKSKE